MNDSRNIKISDIEELYGILPEELREEYAIGFHGFSDRNYLSESESEEVQIDENKIQQAKSNILENGLKIKGDRKLLSTLMFGEEAESYITSKGYPAGVIVALPKVLRSEAGEEIFVGSPNEDKIIEELREYKRQAWDRNREATSLSELVLPGDGVLDSMFIIATYSKTDYGIEVEMNPKHIALNEGKVPNEFFKEKYEKIMEMINYLNMDNSIIEETIEQQTNYSGKFNSSIDYKEALSKSAENMIDQYMGKENKITDEIEDGELDKESIIDGWNEIANKMKIIGREDLASTIQQYIENELTSNKNQDSDVITEHQGISQEKIDRLKMAINEMRSEGISDDTIRGKLGINQTIKLSSPEQWNIIVRTFQKYGIDDIKKEDYETHNFRQSDEMKGIIAELMEQEYSKEIEKMPKTEIKSNENLSLTEIGKKSYQHFGKRIAEKLKETVNAIKSKFFSRDVKEGEKNGR